MAITEGISKHLEIALFLSVVFFMVLASPWQESAIAEDVDVVLRQKIERVEIDNQPMAEAVRLLRYVHKLRVCFEEIEYNEDDATMTTTVDGYRNLVINKKKISVNLTNATVKDVLNSLTIKDEDYFWEVSSSGVINILPRSATSDKYGKSVLNWNVPELVIDGDELIRLGGAAHFWGRTLLEHGIGCEWVSIGPDDLAGRPIHVKMTNASALECLNAIVKSAGNDCFWTLDGYKSTGETIIGHIQVRSFTFNSF